MGDKKFLSHGCTLDCHDCCRFSVEVEDGKVLSIKGEKTNPYTKGFICKKGKMHLDRLNHKDRIYSPMKKVNGVWVEIDFDEALDIMSEKLTYYKNKYSSKSIMHYDQYGTGSVLKCIENIFFNYYGGVCIQKGGPCWSAGMKAQKADFGDVKSNSIDDMKNSKRIILWGKNPANTTIHTMKAVLDAKRNGSKIIVIDPIYTETAKSADLYIRTKPGTDGALALAMMKIIIEKNLIDYNFIKNYVHGFDEFKEYVQSQNLNYLSDECGVSVCDIENLAVEYADSPSHINIGYGIQKYKNGGNTVRLIDSLGIITGQIGIKGGGVSYSNRVYPDILDSDPYKSYLYGENREFYVSDISDFIEKSYETDEPIKMIVVTKSNMLNQLPDLYRLEKVFEDIEFKVCFDMFMTDTASKCDLFIPCTNTLESMDIIYSSMTNPYITVNEKAVNPKHELMDEYYFFRELAKRMKMKEYPYVEKEEYLEKVIAPLKDYDSEISLQKLIDTNFTIDTDIAWADRKFPTETGKIEIYSEYAKSIGGTYIPEYIRNESTDEIEKGGLRLITVHPSDTLSSAHYMDREDMAKVYLNNKMAEKYNVKNSKKVILYGKKGKIEVTAVIDDGVPDYTVKMYVGWWKKHGNPNYLTESGISDFGGQVTYNDSIVYIKK